MGKRKKNKYKKKNAESIKNTSEQNHAIEYITGKIRGIKNNVIYQDITCQRAGKLYTKSEMAKKYNKKPYLKVNKTEYPKDKPPENNIQVWKVRNENIGRIKLPVFCTFSLIDGRVRRLGLLVNDGEKLSCLKPSSPVAEDEAMYSLFEMSMQTNRLIGNRIESMKGYGGLCCLITKYQVNIGKAEINYFE